MGAVYNEIEPFAAAWLRNLIKAELIAAGDVDERSIEDVVPDDYRGYKQVHLFAGIGLWSLSLRRAGYADDDEVWSASCPCQSFSAAGKGRGFADERHLWPAAFHLVDCLRPKRIVGEQVASPDGLAWLDLVHADVAGAGYALWVTDQCVAGVGAPGIRQRLFWMANSTGYGRQQEYPFPHGLHAGDRAQGWAAGSHTGRHPSGVADAYDALRGPNATVGDQRHGQDAGWPQGTGDAQGCGELGCLGRDPGSGRERLGDQPTHRFAMPASPGALSVADAGRPTSQWDAGSFFRAQETIGAQDRSVNGHLIDRPGDGGATDGTGPTNGFWRDADWLGCSDGKWRPVEPGTRPLATGYPSRVGLLRAIGNAINPEVAEAFLRCCP